MSQFTHTSDSMISWRRPRIDNNNSNTWIRKLLILASFFSSHFFLFIFLTKPAIWEATQKESLSYGLSQSSIYQKNPLTQKDSKTHPLLLTKWITHNVTFCKRCHWNMFYCHNCTPYLTIRHKSSSNIKINNLRHSTQFCQNETSGKHAT